MIYLRGSNAPEVVDIPAAFLINTNSLQTLIIKDLQAPEKYGAGDGNRTHAASLEG